MDDEVRKKEKKVFSFNSLYFFSSSLLFFFFPFLLLLLCSWCFFFFFLIQFSKHLCNDLDKAVRKKIYFSFFSFSFHLLFLLFSLSFHFFFTFSSISQSQWYEITLYTNWIRKRAYNYSFKIRPQTFVGFQENWHCDPFPQKLYCTFSIFFLSFFVVSWFCPLYTSHALCLECKSWLQKCHDIAHVTHGTGVKPDWRFCSTIKQCQSVNLSFTCVRFVYRAGRP